MRLYRSPSPRDREGVPANGTDVEHGRLAQTATTLSEISRELSDWVPILRRLAEAEALRDLALGQCSEITGAAVRSIIGARRLREEYFWQSMSESAWTLLLELFANRLEGRRVDADGLSASTGVTLESCLHWLDWLAGRGMIFRHTQPEGEITALVDLTDAGADEMRAYLLASLKLSPWVQ